MAIVVLTWNGEDDTIACLRSLQKVNYPQLRVIVVDNGSQDKTSARIRAEHPWVQLLETGANLGFGAGNNIGIHAALEQGADYILLLNNDTEQAADFLGPLLEAGERDPNVGVLGPKILFFDDPRRLWYGGGWVARWSGAAGHEGLGELDGNGDYLPRDTGYVTGCALLIKTTVLRAVGPLEPTFFAYWEDADLCLRVRRAGFRIVYVPQSKIWHKVSRATGGETADSIFLGGRPHGPESAIALYLGTRNNLLFVERHIPPVTRAGVLTLVLARKVAKMVALALKRRSSSRQKAFAIWLGVQDYFRRRFGPPPWDRLK